jgi:hypothetical protein
MNPPTFRSSRSSVFFGRIHVLTIHRGETVDLDAAAAAHRIAKGLERDDAAAVRAPFPDPLFQLSRDAGPGLNWKSRAIGRQARQFSM